MLRSARSARLEAWAASPSFETRSFGPLLRMRLECVVDFPWRISSETSGDFFDLAARGRADHRLAHRGAVDDLFGWNGEGRSACGGARERLEGGAHDVELVGVPGLCRALHRLELADAELARAPLFRRGAGDMGDTLDPLPSLGAEHLEGKARAGR